MRTHLAWMLTSVLLVAPAFAVTKTQVNTDTAQTISNKTLDSTNTLNGVTLAGTILGTYTFGSNLSVTTGKTLTVGTNVLIGSVADKLNSQYLAIASQAVGDILYADTASTMARLADVATGSYLRSGGVGAAPVWSSLTLPNSATSGGIGCFTSTSAMASSNLLTANALVLGGGAATCPSPMGSLGTTTTVLHGNAAGAPTFSAVVLADTNITKADIVQVYSALTHCKSDVATIQNGLIPLRVAANNWGLSRTAAGAETINIRCDLPVPTRTTSGKGWELTAFSIIQQVTVAALTSNTFNALSTTTSSNNVANAVAAYGGTITITMPTATQAAPYVTAGTVGTPAFMNTSGAQIGVDWTVVMQNTGVYTLYGIQATWTEQL